MASFLDSFLGGALTVGLLFVFLAIGKFGRRVTGGDAAISNQFEETMVLECPLNDVYQYMKNWLENSSFAKAIYTDTEKSEIRASIANSFKSWGEKVLLTFHEDSAGQTIVTVNSCSVVSTTTMDWGKNKENVQIITRYMKEHFGNEAGIRNHS